MTVQFEPIRDADSVEVSSDVRGPVVDARSYAGAGKRYFDIAAVVICSPVLVLLVVIIALYLKMSGQRPFFVQPRLGRHGRVFNMVKFRTMVEDAPERLAAYLDADPEARAEWELTQKLKNDPRITRVGRILRKTSLDELPQILNVLTGDMSLVGPRPMLVEQRDMYPGDAYFELRPGITGPWQISDRNDCEFKARAKYDTRYASEMSIVGDIRILVATLGVVFRATGH